MDKKEPKLLGIYIKHSFLVKESNSSLWQPSCRSAGNIFLSDIIKYKSKY